MRGLVLAGLLGAAASFAVSGAAPAPTRPNILFILADDLGYGDLGSYGQEKIRTPHIDALARAGTRFTDCYAGAAVCAPSRCVLMTGLHTGHARIRNNSPRVGGEPEHFGDGKQRRLSLTADDRTVAEALRAAGYVTGTIGKWGLGEPGTAGTPNQRGFDEFFGYLNNNHAPFYFTDYLWRNETKHPIPENAGGRREVYAHDLFTTEALGFVQRHRERPFFLLLAYTIPHDRLEVPSLEPYASESWPEPAKTYAAMITRMDRDVGRILAELDRLGLARNTIVFFTSDNGARPLPAGSDIFQSTPGFRGKKGSLYEGGLRVPMIVRWPDVVPAGRVSDAPWYFADVLPTLAELAGAKADGAKLDGVSVASLLRGQPSPALANRTLYWEVPGDALVQAARRGSWKAYRARPDRAVELYELTSDLAEARDVAPAHPEIAAEFARVFASGRTESPHWPVARARK